MADIGHDFDQRREHEHELVNLTPHLTVLEPRICTNTGALLLALLCRLVVIQLYPTYAQPPIAGTGLSQRLAATSVRYMDLRCLLLISTCPFSFLICRRIDHILLQNSHPRVSVMSGMFACTPFIATVRCCARSFLRAVPVSTHGGSNLDT